MAEVLLISAATGAVKGILEGLLSLAKDQIKNQIKLAWGYKQDLKKLCKRLEIMDGLLADAENRKITSEAMVAWLNHLKAATCEAENVLNELASEDLRRKTELTDAYFAFLEVLLNSHIAFVLNLDTSSFRYIVGSLEPGLGGLVANILSQVVATRDIILPPRGDSFSYSYTAYELMGTDL